MVCYLDVTANKGYILVQIELLDDGVDEVIYLKTVNLFILPIQNLFSNSMMETERKNSYGNDICN